ncbi:hypothetical protein PVAND_012160 [Polypedilum vanderplanki]|uniref:Male-enhanced antigen 1 n=1 Tax=Polypedilum vanderplanki TaxID=319348 RepID=A0A9J6CMK0_POLVA|nr:hypothetical protein PVAND_012160 [Polypedilum vanderplanki]
MGPDPEKISNNGNFEQHSEYIMNQIDDDDGMEVNEQNNEGYLRLNLDNVNEYIPANDSTDDESDDEEENEFSIPENVQQANTSLNIPPSINVPNITTASSEIVASLWNQKNESSNGNDSSIELSTEKSQQITQIMSKISLPNAPNWLDELSTEVVLERIRRRTETDSINMKST